MVIVGGGSGSDGQCGVNNVILKLTECKKKKNNWVSSSQSACSQC